MASTVIAMFDRRDEARETERDLLSAGFHQDQVHLVERPAEPGAEGEGWWDRVKSFFGAGAAEERELYREAARRGGVLLTADVPDAEAETVAEIMRRHHPVDMERHTAEGGAPAGETTTAPTGRTAEGEARIPVAEERMKVGKREVARGGVRIHRTVTEQPVEEEVRLREEHVRVERQPTDRPVEPGDRAFEERTVEAAETGEEPVVEKEARIVEEVRIGKDVEERTEEVRGTVRREDVEVERIGEDELRRDYETYFAQRGYPYEHYRRSFEYGDRLALEGRYMGRDWAVIEPEIRSTYESQHPGRWEQDREAIRRGYERRRGRAV